MKYSERNRGILEERNISAKAIQVLSRQQKEVSLEVLNRVNQMLRQSGISDSIADMNQNTVYFSSTNQENKMKIHGKIHVYMREAKLILLLQIKDMRSIRTHKTFQWFLNRRNVELSDKAYPFRYIAQEQGWGLTGTVDYKISHREFVTLLCDMISVLRQDYDTIKAVCLECIPDDIKLQITEEYAVYREEWNWKGERDGSGI